MTLNEQTAQEHSMLSAVCSHSMLFRQVGSTWFFHTNVSRISPLTPQFETIISLTRFSEHWPGDYTSAPAGVMQPPCHTVANETPIARGAAGSFSVAVVSEVSEFFSLKSKQQLVKPAAFSCCTEEGRRTRSAWRPTTSHTDHHYWCFWTVDRGFDYMRYRHCMEPVYH